MFILEEPKLRKRRRPSEDPADIEQVPPAKKQRSTPESSAGPGHRRFWDTLSKIWLSYNALGEFDCRTNQETSQPDSVPTPVVECPTGRARQRLKRFARQGGPDLSDLRGFASFPLPFDDMAIGSTRSQSRKRPSTSRRGSFARSLIRPYSRNFKQKLIDEGVYPADYRHPDGHPRPEPVNLNEIHNKLTAARPSLSVPRFAETEFRAFMQQNDMVLSEAAAMSSLIPIIAGTGDRDYHSGADDVFNNLEPLDKNLSDPQPDVYYGAPPSAIDRRVRSELDKYIIPSTDTSRPAAPNFFLEGKGPCGRADVAKIQALYYGTMGARAMHKLQNYGADELVYDNKAYSFTSTYHAGTGTLQIYAMHLTQPTVPGGKPEYHMTQLRSFAMTDTLARFREGAAAYRNLRDLAMSQRNNFIKKANQVARQLPPPNLTTIFTDSRASLSKFYEIESETSADELALDYVAPIKRQKPARAQRNSYAGKTKQVSRQTPSSKSTTTSTGTLPSLSRSLTDESETSLEELALDDVAPIKRQKSARAQRNSSAGKAKQVSRRAPFSKSTTISTGSRTSLSKLYEVESETSADELALDYVAPIKRQKSARAQRNSSAGKTKQLALDYVAPIKRQKSARAQRNSSAGKTKQVSRQMPSSKSTTISTGSRTSLSRSLTDESETSADEQARNELTLDKRLRRAQHPASYKSLSGRHYHTTPSQTPDGW
ncbi:uncharacterized protein Z518_08265 [Rhinocladiella mackenziei CBS 650.93]|uniref:Rhinocladiella mackenziei CBS 650.93 unplaced genomic scaffold supercont1.6, whole genome shotgun sequence n=1 Tax=Rhinocladiella mackenziei CBS 650.93 TaxID=1442369 RepID=A0A0D2I906_9EURO|nr:uncharacterized protein Z518_08265 [Rhinocladiella mackenziei CBS 650.93]KIX02324.1 hypothetical protein Z518_08265 [Rhinocladiella mackenziei CBS 650.93]